MPTQGSPSDPINVSTAIFEGLAVSESVHRLFELLKLVGLQGVQIPQCTGIIFHVLDLRHVRDPNNAGRARAVAQ